MTPSGSHHPRQAPIIQAEMQHALPEYMTPTGEDPLYCSTTALDGYPLHSDKIYYIQMVTSFYICGTTFYNPWYQHLHPCLRLSIHILLLADICFHPS